MFLKGHLFYKLENLTHSLGPAIRKQGQQLFNQGMAMQGEMAHTDTMQPSLRCVPISNSKYPKSLEADWIAPNAVLVGDVTLGEGSSAWHGAKLRGDTCPIKVGKNSVIQDNTRIGSNSAGEAAEISIGDNVYIGANASVDSDADLESFAYVGMGATVGKGSTVQSFGVLAAGAKLADGDTVPSGQIFAGTPAHYLRDLTQQEKHLIGEHHVEMQQLAQVYNENTELTEREQLEQQDNLLRYMFQDPQERIKDELLEMGMPITHDDLEYIEHRVYHDYVGSVEYGITDSAAQEESLTRSYVPYEQDLSQYPEVFKKY